MGFFSDLFGIGGNDNAQSNNNGGVYQTAYMACQYCQHIEIEYDDNGKKIYSCTKGHGQYGKLGNVFIEDTAGNIIDNPHINIEYANYCSGYGFEKYYPEDPVTPLRNPSLEEKYR